MLFASGCGVQDVDDFRIVQDLEACRQAALVGDTNHAMMYADQAIAVEPGNEHTYLDPPQYDGEGAGVHLIFLSVCDYKTDEHYLQQAAKDFPKDFQVFLDLAETQRMLGETAEEANSAKTAEGLIVGLQKKGNYSNDELASLGEAYWLAGDNLKSYDTYQTLITRFDANYYDAYNALAYEYAEANDTANLKKAEDDVTYVIEKAEKSTKDSKLEALVMYDDTLGWVKYRQGDYNEALADIQKSVDLDEREPETRYHLAMVYLALRNKPEAKAEVQRILQLAPEYADAKALDDQLRGVSPPSSLNVADLLRENPNLMPGYPSQALSLFAPNGGTRIPAVAAPDASTAPPAAVANVTKRAAPTTVPAAGTAPQAAPIYRQSPHPFP